MELPQKQLDRWFAKAPGKTLLAAESNVLSDLLPRLFGYHLLQIGGPGQSEWLDAARIPHRIHLSPGCPCHFKGSCLIGNLEELPFAPDSIDVVLLPHMLEFTRHPQQILQEVYNILIPGGYVVILGFHTWSLWGLARLMKDHKEMPWRGTFYSSHRIRHWLTQLGYSIEDHKTLYFRPPLEDAEMLEKLSFMESIGSTLWPFLGGAYLILAKKRVASLTQIRPNSNHKRVRIHNSVPQPTARSSDG